MSKKQQHDTHFKLNFNIIEVGKAFLQHNLPKEMLAWLNLDTLQVVSNELLPSQGQRKKFADVIYSVKDKTGGEVHALIQLEAQSSPDKNMAIRVWEYHVAVARAYLSREQKTKIPLILNFVLYNGKAEWEGDSCLADMFENFEVHMQTWKMNFVIDMRKKSFRELGVQGAAAAPQMMMKGRAEGTFLDAFPHIYEKMVEHRQDTVENIDYMVSHEGKNSDKLLENFSNLAPDKTSEYKVMFEKAIHKGLERGLKQGLEKGRLESTLRVAKNLLKQGLDSTMIAKATGLSKAQINALA